MERTYDIFEIKDGQPIWRAAVTGHEPAIEHMRSLSEKSNNEFRLLHVPTGSLVAVIDAKNPQLDEKRPQEGKSSGKTEITRRKRRSSPKRNAITLWRFSTRGYG